MVLPLETNMEVMGKRYPCIGEYTVEVDDEGRIQYLNNEIWQDFGHSLNESVVPLTTKWFLNCYDTKYWNYNAWAVLTDSASNTFCRAPGILEGISMVENIFEHIAFEMGMCPIQVRLMNMAEDHRLRKMIKDFLLSTGKLMKRTPCSDALYLYIYSSRIRVPEGGHRPIQCGEPLAEAWHFHCAH